MKTFGELKEGDKLFIWAGKPMIGPSKSKDYQVSKLLVSSIYTINKIRKCGFYIAFSISTVIGNSFDCGSLFENQINLSPEFSVSNRTVWILLPNWSSRRQKLIITTSEEKWLELINENV